MLKAICFLGHLMLLISTNPDSKRFKGIYLENIVLFSYAGVVLVMLGINIILKIVEGGGLCLK